MKRLKTILDDANKEIRLITPDAEQTLVGSMVRDDNDKFWVFRPNPEHYIRLRQSAFVSPNPLACQFYALAAAIDAGFVNP